MGVRALPHQGKHVAIDVRGQQTIFGWECSRDALRPITQPDGKAWPTEGIVRGWQRFDENITASVTAMIDHAREGHVASASEYRLEISPEVAAHLRASNAYSVASLLSYSDVTNGGVELIEFKIGRNGATKIEMEWRHTGNVTSIRVSPAYEGIRLATTYRGQPPA